MHNISNQIAIIGIAGKYPKSNTPHELWGNIIQNIDLHDEASANTENEIGKFFILEGIDKFDNIFFGYSAYEASLMDPQHRILMRCSKEALEDSGYEKETDDNKIGVFVTASLSTYLLNNLIGSEHYKSNEINYPILIGNDKDFLATKIAYKLNLTGPAINIQTACSSSLVAVHYACKSLLSGECNTALVGGVSISTPMNKGFHFKEGGILSPDGICRPFDNTANGTIKGNGCSVVVLRKLTDAINDNDRIYAVIKGSAVNNDGSGKIGYVAPSITGQANVIRDALASANLSVQNIDYIETHGTGTKLGDPIELKALSVVFQNTIEKIPLGSVKANIGHLDAAAGITSLVKSVLMIKHSTIPKIKNFSIVNEAINSIQHPFIFPTEHYTKKLNNIGISSFGIGGTNAHVIIGSYCRKVVPIKKSLPYYLIPISLNSTMDFEAYKNNLIAHIKQFDFRDFVFSMTAGKILRKISTIITAATKEDFIAKLQKIVIDDFTTDILMKLNDNSVLIEYLSSLKCIGHWNFSTDVVKFDHLYRNLNYSRIPLAPYPLQEKSFWIETSHVNQSKQSPLKIYEVNWQEEDIINNIISIWTRATGEKNITDSTSYFDLGVDSLTAIEIIDQINIFYKLKISPVIFYNHHTPEALASWITKNSASNASSFLTQIRKSQNPKILFLIHPAGGTTFCYNSLNYYLKGDYNVYCFDLPENYQSFPTMSSLASHYAHKIMQCISLKSEYIIGGYSFGGNLAHEITVQLENAGEKVKKVIMFDSHIPKAYNAFQSNEIDYKIILPDILCSYFGNSKIPAHVKETLQDKSFKEIISYLKSENILNTTLTLAEIENFYEKWIFNHKLLKNHFPSQKIGAELLLFIANEPEDLWILNQLSIQPIDKNEWAHYISGKFTVFSAIGNHYSLFGNKNNIYKLATQLDNIFCE